MGPRQDTESVFSGRLPTYWARLDRGWQAVVLGLAVVGLQWLLQTIQWA